MPRVLITGANRGIGLALAERYAWEGWKVLATCRNPSAASELAQVQRATGGDFRVLPLDVSDSGRIANLATTLAGTPIDVIINGAGVSPIGLEDLDCEGFERAMRVNAYPVLAMARHFLEHLTASDRRTMVTLSSLMGSIGLTQGGPRYAYRASKAAVNMLVRALAGDLASRGVICVSLHPGWVRTRMGGPQATLAPSESAAALVHLINHLSPAHSGGFYAFDGSPIPW